MSFPEHASQSGICAYCTLCGKCEIAKKARTAFAAFPQPFGLQFGAEKRIPSLDDLQILPELYGNAVEFHKVDTGCEIGGFKMSAPLVIGAMGSTKVAHLQGRVLAEGAAKAGIGAVIGENVLASHGKEGLKERIKPFVDNYEKKGTIVVQGNENDIKAGLFEEARSLGAMAIEVKLGQGAKQNLGGEIEFSSEEDAERYKKLGYTVTKHDDRFLRHSSPGSISDNGLRTLLVKYAELGMPIWVKVGIGTGILKLVQSLQKIKKEQRIPLKCLTVDGHGGGTGMSPWLVMNEFSLPSAALFGALEKKPDFDILLAGGLADGIDIAKAMMLGASGASMGRAFLIAAKATTAPEQRAGAKAAPVKVLGAEGIANFVRAVSSELQMACATQRITSAKGLIGRRKNLFALTSEAESLFHISSDPKKSL